MNQSDLQVAVDAATRNSNRTDFLQRKVDNIPAWVFVLGNPNATKRAQKAAIRAARKMLEIQ